jgi:putative transposase
MWSLLIVVSTPSLAFSYDVVEAELLTAIKAISDEFEAYGWCRVRAALRHQDVLANHKRIRRLMREHDLQPRRRRRYVGLPIVITTSRSFPILPRA